MKRAVAQGSSALKRARRGAVELAYEDAAGASAGAAAAPAVPSRRAKASAAASSSSSSSSSAAAAATASSAAAAPASPAAAGAVEAQPGSPARGWGKPIAPHPAWRRQLARIRAMRAPGGASHPAAVDTMGCERCADPAAPAPVRRFQTLVSLMLSSQTKDEVNYAACQRLKDGLGALGFTAAGCAAASKETLARLIYPVGFYNVKAASVQAAAQACLEQHGGDIPASVEALCRLKGVGPKMAFICMAAAWGRPVGIGVDTHVHRISNRLGWVKTTNPLATQAHLQEVLPREEWDDLNVLLVGFGQLTCSPINPKCDGCAVRAVCPEGAGRKASLEAAAAAGCDC